MNKVELKNANKLTRAIYHKHAFQDLLKSNAKLNWGTKMGLHCMNYKLIKMKLIIMLDTWQTKLPYGISNKCNDLSYNGVYLPCVALKIELTVNPCHQVLRHTPPLHLVLYVRWCLVGKAFVDVNLNKDATHFELRLNLQLYDSTSVG